MNVVICAINATNVAEMCSAGRKGSANTCKTDTHEIRITFTKKGNMSTMKYNISVIFAKFFKVNPN